MMLPLHIVSILFSCHNTTDILLSLVCERWLHSCNDHANLLLPLCYSYCVYCFWPLVFCSCVLPSHYLCFVSSIRSSVIAVIIHTFVVGPLCSSSVSFVIVTCVLHPLINERNEEHMTQFFFMQYMNVITAFSS